MATYFCRLLPPRASFALDMAPDEATLMQEHAVYWHEGIARGSVVVFGLVGDPNGPYGIGIVEFPDEAGVREFTDGDPAIRAGRGFRYEVLPMPMGVAAR